MNILDRLRLFILEEKLKVGAFGKYNRYRCWCLERNVTSVAEKLGLAREVLAGPGVGLAESQHNTDFIRKHLDATQKATSRPKDIPAVNPEARFKPLT